MAYPKSTKILALRLWLAISRWKYRIEELDEVYDKCNKSSFKLNNFIKVNKDILNSVFLTRKELDLLLIKYVKEFKTG